MLQLHGKCVVLGVTGGIAAYKVANVASALRKAGADVHVIMTKNATEFITPLTFETLTNNRCVVDTFARDFKYCMRSGAVMGAAAMIDGITAGFERELGKKATLLLTGGLARFAAPLCRHEYVYDPGLLPKGLALLYDLNIREPALVLETALLEVSEELELREEKIS